MWAGLSDLDVLYILHWHANCNLNSDSLYVSLWPFSVVCDWWVQEVFGSSSVNHIWLILWKREPNSLLLEQGQVQSDMYERHRMSWVWTNSKKLDCYSSPTFTLSTCKLIHPLVCSPTQVIWSFIYPIAASMTHYLTHLTFLLTILHFPHHNQMAFIVLPLKKERAVRNFIPVNAEPLLCFNVHVCTSYIIVFATSPWCQGKGNNVRQIV